MSICLFTGAPGSFVWLSIATTDTQTWTKRAVLIEKWWGSSCPDWGISLTNIPAPTVHSPSRCLLGLIHSIWYTYRCSVTAQFIYQTTQPKGALFLLLWEPCAQTWASSWPSSLEYLKLFVGELSSTHSWTVSFCCRSMSAMDSRVSGASFPAIVLFSSGRAFSFFTYQCN